MFSLRDRCAVALLLALMQTLASASLKENKEKGMPLIEAFFMSRDAPLIDGMKSVLRDLDSNSSCAAEISALLAAVKAGELWALEMLDASSKIQSGILNGNLRDLGMYGQCIRSSGRYNGTDVKGKHCTIAYITSYAGNFTGISDTNIPLVSSICIPSSCETLQVAEIMNTTYESLSNFFDPGVRLTFIGSSCARIESEDFTSGEIVTILFFALIGVVIVSCTTCDFVKRSEIVSTNRVTNTLAKFSLYTNAISIFSTKKTSGLMPELQGIRFLCMCWVILGHRYILLSFAPTVNPFDVIEWSDTWEAAYIQAGPFAVDTFFVISGFLMTYQYLKTMQSGTKVNIPVIYIHRYIRLTPCLAVVMLFVIFLLHRVSNGPIWSLSSVILTTNCEKNWWQNFLYIQNLVDPEEMCLGHSWYLAVDMQLFWISPIVLYPLYQWPKYGLTLLVCVLGIFIAIPPIVLAVNDFRLGFLNPGNPDLTFGSFCHFYIVTYTRAGAYFVGIFLGYEVANSKRFLSKATVAINWILACAALVFCIWINHMTYKKSYEYNKPLEITSALILRPLWSAATAWIAYACTQGYGGFLARFLSIPIFLPLCRLSYCIYLVHFVIQVVKISFVQIPSIFQPFHLFNEFLADLFLSIVVALLLSLFFESPIVILEKMLRNRGRRSHKPALDSELKKDTEVGFDNRTMSSMISQQVRVTSNYP